MKIRDIILCFFALTSLAIPLVSQISEVNPEVLQKDEVFLKDFAESLRKIQAPDDEIKDQWWLMSKKAAAKTGPHVIHALMKQSESWKGEEVLLYVPLVVLLDRAPTLKLIKEYESSKIEAHRTCANDLLAEFDASDTKAARRKYTRK